MTSTSLIMNDFITKYENYENSFNEELYYNRSSNLIYRFQGLQFQFMDDDQDFLPVPSFIKFDCWNLSDRFNFQHHYLLDFEREFDDFVDREIQMF